MSQRNIALEDSLAATIHAYTQGQHRYMNEFVQQYKSAADLLALDIYPDSKEITESMGALNAVRKYLKQYDLNDPTITLVSVGDGRSPRTAALFAFKTKWNCISIDPGMDKTKIPMWEKKIQRLMCIPLKIEDIKPMCYERVVIVAVHSHADMRNTLNSIQGNTERSLVAIPCCFQWGKGFVKPYREYNDSGIWSPKNRVKVWRKI
jgi:hypothetical protein